MGRWTGTEYVPDNDGTNTETRFSHQDENGNYMSVTKEIGTDDADFHTTRSYNSSGEVTNTHNTWTDESGKEQHYGDKEIGSAISTAITYILGL